MTFTALSLYQPWPWLILRPDATDPAAREALRGEGKIKDVENRIWAAKQRGWVLLHASDTKSSRARWAGDAAFAAQLGVEVPLQVQLPRGAVVGAMRIDGCERWVRSRWFAGPVGFVIGAAVPFAEPVPCKGALKFFPLPASGSGPGGLELAEQLAAAIRGAGLAREFGLGVEDQKNFAPPPVVGGEVGNLNL